MMRIVQRAVRFIYTRAYNRRSARADDIFLVAFPKSGTTWLSFLIANVTSLYLKLGVSITFFNVHHFVPEVADSIPPTLEYFPFRRFRSTHTTYNPSFKYVVLLVRNPADTLISYYHYLTALGKYNGSISAFVRDSHYGARAWAAHTRGWLMHSTANQRVHIMHYENLREDPARELRTLYTVLGFSLSDELLAQAVDASQFNTMKKLEQETAGYTFKKNKSFKFVRKGMTTYGKELSTEDMAYVESQTSAVLAILNAEKV